MRGSGPKLKFSEKEKYTMPDLLFRSQKDTLFWVESKSSFRGNKEVIDIEFDKIDDYYSIQEKTRKTTWLVVTIVRNGYCDIYSSPIKKLKNKTADIELENNPNYKKPVYRFYLKDLFAKLNKNPICLE